MPELPEVETIVRDLRKEIVGRSFVDVWTDTESLIKKDNFISFKKNIVGRKIMSIERRGKNILIGLDDDNILLIHQKLSGHLLLGNWKFKDNILVTPEGPLSDDPMNRFVHVIFYLDNKEQLALSDLRKFAKIAFLNKSEVEEELSNLGPEPLEDDFTFEKFKNLFIKKKGKIKQVLMDQAFIVGIGNIYASEILFKSKIYPEEKIENLKEGDFKNIYNATRNILNESIKLKGDSFADFRTIYGEKGGFHNMLKVYQRKGKDCVICGTKIERINLGGRGSFFCPNCQKRR
jgi:formamidopyrimidine-DNA glycosylase